MALDILHDNWGPYTHTEVENALKAYLAVLENRINQAIQSGGVGLTDLSQEVQALLAKANTALQPESIAAWAKAQNKPGYNVSEITYSNLLTLAEKLADMDQKIQEAAQSGVTVDSQLADSGNPVANRAVKAAIDSLRNALNTLIGSGNVQGAIDTFNEVKAFLDGIDTDDPKLANQLLALNNNITALNNTLSTKANDADVVKGIKDSNGNTLPKSNGIVTLPESQGGLTKEDISVETQGDGTVDINVGSDTYTINLNHTHENMAKLVVCEESDLPSTLDPATIYAQVNDASNPTEIEVLYIAGLEFAGGGGGGLPVVTSPREGSTINLGTHHGQGVSQSVTVIAKNLNYGGSTDGLTIEAIGTGLTLSYGQQTGQSSITIPQVNGRVNAEVSVSYNGSVSLLNGSLRFKQGSTLLSSVDVSAELVLPSGFTANKAWDDNGNGAAVLENAQGYCVSPKITMVNNHTFEICFGFTRSTEEGAPKYGCATNDQNTDFISAGTASTCYSATTSGNTRTVVMTGLCLSCTFLMSEVDNCYIKDTTTNTYLYKGNNVT